MSFKIGELLCTASVLRCWHRLNVYDYDRDDFNVIQLGCLMGSNSHEASSRNNTISTGRNDSLNVAQIHAGVVSPDKRSIKAME